MKKANVLLVLTEDDEVLVTSVKEYNEEEGFEDGDGYVEEFDCPVSLEEAKSYGNGNKEWDEVLEKYSDCELFEIEMGWGENAMILVK